MGDVSRAGLIEALKAAAICNTSSPADAVTALVRAATEILSVRFGPAEICEMFVEWAGEASALAVPAGRA